MKLVNTCIRIAIFLNNTNFISYLGWHWFHQEISFAVQSTPSKMGKFEENNVFIYFEKNKRFTKHGNISQSSSLFNYSHWWLVFFFNSLKFRLNISIVNHLLIANNLCYFEHKLLKIHFIIFSIQFVVSSDIHSKLRICAKHVNNIYNRFLMNFKFHKMKYFKIKNFIKYKITIYEYYFHK